jgi:hypothetical protein
VLNCVTTLRRALTQPMRESRVGRGKTILAEELRANSPAWAGRRAIKNLVEQPIPERLGVRIVGDHTFEQRTLEMQPYLVRLLVPLATPSGSRLPVQEVEQEAAELRRPWRGLDEISHVDNSVATSKASSRSAAVSRR